MGKRSEWQWEGREGAIPQLQRDLQTPSCQPLASLACPPAPARAHLDTLVEDCVAGVACRLCVCRHLCQHVAHGVAGLRAAPPQQAQQAQDGHLRERVVDAADIVVCRQWGRGEQGGQVTYGGGRVVLAVMCLVWPTAGEPAAEINTGRVAGKAGRQPRCTHLAQSRP